MVKEMWWRVIEEIGLGDFTIYRDEKGILWICRDGDEIMECNGETYSALCSLIEQFWEANF